MKRRRFIKSTGLIGMGLAVIPKLTFQHNAQLISYDELIGKGNPEVFGKGHKLRKDAHDAFLDMSAKALKSDIKLYPVSSYRNFAHQNRIWERKYEQHINNGLSPIQSINKIIEYSTIPGTSRHHWGTDIDLIDVHVQQPKHVLNPKHFKNNGCFLKFKNWMDINANQYGFYLVYNNETNREGFKYEPWHYSYKPLSQNYLREYKKLDLSTIIKTEQLMGCEYFSQEFTTHYLNKNILDINPVLL